MLILTDEEVAVRVIECPEMELAGTCITLCMDSSYCPETA